MFACDSSIISPTIFRAYDIRGIVGQTLTVPGIYRIGQAIAAELQQQGGKCIALARDGRASGVLFAETLQAAFINSGCNVYDLGPVPTPLLYYATQQFAEGAGVMITGSHNPAEYNGLKITLGGKALADTEIKRLYQRIQTNRFIQGNGTYHQYDLRQAYLQHCLNDIHLRRPLKVIVDAGNGVAGELAPQLYRALGCDVSELFCDIDGTFPNHEPDPSHPANLQVLRHHMQVQQADIGLAFDGDGDRLGIVTNKGTFITSDRILMLFAQSVLANQPQAKVIYDVKCSSHLQPFIMQLHGQPIMWKTGHSLIKMKMVECNAQLAGEMSGHFFFRDRWYGFDDALYAGARLLEILSAQSFSAEDLFATLPSSIATPELKIKVNEEDKFALMQTLLQQAHFQEAKRLITIDGLRVEFVEGWGLIRPSNTSPYLILRFEAATEGFLQHMQSLFREWLLSVRADLVLPF